MPPKKPITAPSSLGFDFAPSEAITRPRLPGYAASPETQPLPTVAGVPEDIQPPELSPEVLDAFDDYAAEQEADADPPHAFPHVSVVRDGEAFVVSRMAATMQYARVMYTRSELEELISRARAALEEP